MEKEAKNLEQKRRDEMGRWKRHDNDDVGERRI